MHYYAVQGSDEGSRLTVFEQVCADIGDEQSIEQSLSTFSSHMSHIIRILETVGEHALVLLDELGAGTDPSEGAGLGIAIIEKLLDQGALIALTTRCIDTCEHSLSVIEELDELLAMGFRGLEVEKVDGMLRELNEIEDETDELGIALARVLFEHEDEMKPVSVMMWYQLVEWIGDLADYAEKVGDHLRLLIAK